MKKILNLNSKKYLYIPLIILTSCAPSEDNVLTKIEYCSVKYIENNLNINCPDGTTITIPNTDTPNTTIYIEKEKNCKDKIKNK